MRAVLPLKQIKQKAITKLTLASVLCCSCHAGHGHAAELSEGTAAGAAGLPGEQAVAQVW